MSSPTANSSVREPNNAARRLVNFPFPVTWACLSKGVIADGAPHPAPARPPVVFTASPPPTDPPGREITSVVQIGSSPSPPDSGAQWEMVIPKMSRPRRRPEPQRLPKPSEDQSDPIADAESVPSVSPPPAKVPVPWKPALIAAAMAGVLFAGAIAMGRGTKPQRSGIAPLAAETSWVRERAQDRQFMLYRISQDQSDYRLQFDWVADSKGVGWVFRVRDPGNYYAARIKLAQPGTPPAFTIEHFAVIAGRESEHLSKTGSLNRNDPVIRVSMDASGPAFALNVQGSRVASWSDARLPSGGLGFLEESNQEPAVQTVLLSFSTPGRDFQGSFKDLEASLP